MVKSINHLFISLISKRKGAIELKDYIPISLISSVYKIASNLLTERPKTVIGKLVSGIQNAFVRGRQITDARGILVAQLVDNLNPHLISESSISPYFRVAYEHA